MTDEAVLVPVVVYNTRVLYSKCCFLCFRCVSNCYKQKVWFIVLSCPLISDGVSHLH